MDKYDIVNRLMNYPFKSLVNFSLTLNQSPHSYYPTPGFWISLKECSSCKKYAVPFASVLLAAAYSQQLSATVANRDASIVDHVRYKSNKWDATNFLRLSSCFDVVSENSME